MNIPPPYPDEHVLGWRGRIRLFNHYPDLRHTVAKLRSWVSEQKLHDQPPVKGLPQLMLLANVSGMEQRDFAMKHSSLPFTRAFMPDAFDAKNNLQVTINVVGLYGLQTGKKGAWFCPECVIEDMMSHGMPYWRRDHQLSGVNWCYLHQCKLLGILSRDAFAKPPPTRLFGIDFLQSDGPQFLKDTTPFIQSFATIAKALLGRPSPLAATKVTTLLRRQALTLRPAGNTVEEQILQYLAEEKIPDFWRRLFCQIKGPGKGRYLLDFSTAFRPYSGTASTVMYVAALALLFETPVEALLKLDEAEDVETVSENMKLRYEREFWSSDYVLQKYTKTHGSYASFSIAAGTDYQRTLSSLPAHGLPNLSTVSDQLKIALLAFFSGAALSDICQTYHLQTKDIEDLLRIAGSRFAKGLQEMTKHI